MAMSLRRAESSDMELVLGWRNDPFIVARSTLRKTVDSKEHQQWFGDMLKSTDVVMFIVEEESIPIGQVRFDRMPDGRQEISAYLLEEFTGSGRGVEAIRMACEELGGSDDIVANVRCDNAEGQKAFERAGFDHDGDVDLHGVTHCRFRLETQRSRK